MSTKEFNVKKIACHWINQLFPWVLKSFSERASEIQKTSYREAITSVVQSLAPLSPIWFHTFPLLFAYPGLLDRLQSHSASIVPEQASWDICSWMGFYCFTGVWSPCRISSASLKKDLLNSKKDEKLRWFRLHLSSIFWLWIQTKHRIKEAHHHLQEMKVVISHPRGTLTFLNLVTSHSLKSSSS
jgi:hypothetical protein